MACENNVCRGRCVTPWTCGLHEIDAAIVEACALMPQADKSDPIREAQDETTELFDPSTHWGGFVVVTALAFICLFAMAVWPV